MVWVLPAAALQSKCVLHEIKYVQEKHTCYHEGCFGQTEETRTFMFIFTSKASSHC